MSVYLNAFQKIQRAYPSLNLMILVNKNQHAMQVVLPGLRFDDIDHTGQPNIVTMFDMMSHVETAGFGNQRSFLDYIALRNQNLRMFVKACVMEINSEFYEATTPKAPLDVQVKLCDIGNTTFTSVNELYCGGKLKPSIRTRNTYAFVNKMTGDAEKVPEWWRAKFASVITPNVSKKLYVPPVEKAELTHKCSVTVPLNDTDHNERTRCSAYLRYFSENTSLASRKELFKSIRSSFQEFYIKRLSLLYFNTTKWGDELTSETWQGNSPLLICCSITKDLKPILLASMELYENVYGLPSLETTKESSK